MLESHGSPYVGQRGIQTIMQAIGTYFYWPCMKQDVHHFVENCIVCQKVKFDNTWLTSTIAHPNRSLGEYLHGLFIWLTQGSPR